MRLLKQMHCFGRDQVLTLLGNQILVMFCTSILHICLLSVGQYCGSTTHIVELQHIVEVQHILWKYNTYCGNTTHIVEIQHIFMSGMNNTVHVPFDSHSN